MNEGQVEAPAPPLATDRRGARAGGTEGTSHRLARPGAQPGAAPHRRRSWAEFALAYLALGLLGFAVYGSQIWNGGLYWDDWAWAYRTTFPAEDSFLGLADNQLLEFRPLLAIWLVVPFKLFGVDPAGHLALGLALAVLTAACAFWLLRHLGLRTVEAGAVAALALLFPWADSTVLYSTNAMNHLPLAMYLVGVVLAIKAFDSRGPRAVLLVFSSVALYVLSVLIYEVATVAAMASVGVYLLRAPWRLALARWVVDLVAVGLAVWYVTQVTPRKTGSLADSLDHARVIASQALTILGSAVVPFADPPRAVGLALVALVLGGGIVGWAVLSRGRRSRAELGRWVLVAVVAGYAIAAAYAVFVPAEPKYSPLEPGTGNRVNILAALGFGALLFAVARVAGVLAAVLTRGGGRVAGPVTAVLAVAFGAGFVDRVREDKGHWAEAAAGQARVLDVIERRVPPDRRGSTIVTLGERNYVAPGVPLFAVGWDLRSAVRILFNDRDLGGVAARPHTVWLCGSDTVVPAELKPGARRPRPYSSPSRYGRGVFVDIPRNRVMRLTDRDDCRRSLPQPPAGTAA